MNKMEPKHKILVLTDLKESTESVVNHTSSLASLIDSEILFVHVKKPTSVVSSHNQLSAMRSFNKDYVKTSTSVHNLAGKIGVNTEYKLLYGNVKTEINSILKEYKPNTVILGKRIPKFSKIIGDGITDFILKKHQGAVLIAAEGKHISELTNLSLGALNNSATENDNKFVSALIKRSEKPLTVFKTRIANLGSQGKNEPVTDQVEFVFDHGNNVMDKISKYMSISKINMLFLSRSKQMSRRNSNSISQFRSLIKKVDASVLVTG